jgi:hypothetical protein
MHAMLRDFVNSPRRRILVETEEVVQRAGALADRVSLINSSRDVNFRQNYRIAQFLPGRQLCRDCR